MPLFLWWLPYSSRWFFLKLRKYKCTLNDEISSELREKNAGWDSGAINYFAYQWMWIMLNTRLHSPQAFQKCWLLAWSSAKQNTLLSHHWYRVIKLCAIHTQFRSWLNWTLTGRSIPPELFGRWDYGSPSTATLQTADSVQVSQPTAITANHLHPVWAKKEPACDTPS